VSPPRFGPTALALCGLAARALGWRPDEFWAATPAELAVALGLLVPGAGEAGIDRATLRRMMEQQDDR
jgi:uncharacterized phage protein (TIGR02216 family)